MNSNTVIHDVPEVSLDDAFAEYAAEKAEKEAVARKEQEAREEAMHAEWRAKQVQERVARIARDSRLFAGIVREINRTRTPVYDPTGGKTTTRGHTACYDAEGKFWVDGIDCSYNIHTDEERTHYSSWRSKGTGRYRIVVGDYGNRQSYPQKKDGTYSYDKIAERLIDYAAKRIRERRAKEQADANLDLSEGVRGSLGLGSYEDYQVSPSSHGPGLVSVSFKICHTLTPEKAVALGETLRAMGIKLRYDDVRGADGTYTPKARTTTQG